MGKWLLLLWLGLASLLLFGMMGADKKKAKRGQWRIPEKTLFLVAICGGAVGGTLGMYQFHHKTKHWISISRRFAAVAAGVSLDELAKKSRCSVHSVQFLGNGVV